MTNLDHDPRLIAIVFDKGYYPLGSLIHQILV